MGFRNKKSWIPLIMGGVILFIIFYSCFGERGFMSVVSLREELKQIQDHNQRLKEENAELERYIYLLNNDEGCIERIAREELGLVKADEIIYLFENN
jgi:cell division protein FtsB